MNEVSYCPDCWNPMPPDTPRCPHCGGRPGSSDMRRQREIAARVDIERRRRGGCGAVLLTSALLAAFFSLARACLLFFGDALF